MRGNLGILQEGLARESFRECNVSGTFWLLGSLREEPEKTARGAAIMALGQGLGRSASGARRFRVP